MQNYSRVGGSWFTTVDTEKKLQFNLHLDKVRQVMVNALVTPVFVIEGSYFTTPYEDGAVTYVPTDADLKKLTPFTLDGETEMVIIIDSSAGKNPVVAFESIATICVEMVLGKHRAMTYKSYLAFQAGRGNTKPGSLYLDDASSPTGRIAVWDVTFTRTYGTDKNGLYAILSEQAKYRAGYMGSVETAPGKSYNVPKDFYLYANVTGTDYLHVLQNLLTHVQNSSDLATTEVFWVKQ